MIRSFKNPRIAIFAVSAAAVGLLTGFAPPKEKTPANPPPQARTIGGKTPKVVTVGPVIRNPDVGTVTCAPTVTRYAQDVSDAAGKAAAINLWSVEVNAIYDSSLANWANARNKTLSCTQSGGNPIYYCTAKAEPCSG